MVDFYMDSKTSLLKLEGEYYSPKVERKLVKDLTIEINPCSQNRDMGEACKNIRYPQGKISEMRPSFCNMIGAQAKTFMLAEVSDEYLTKTVVPAIPPDEKGSPKRALIVLVSCFFTTILVTSLVLIGALFLRNYENDDSQEEIL